jgi:hypothetical protein
MPRETRETAAVRREYEHVKRLYHKVGKKAAGKPASSQEQRDYTTVKTEYHRLGRLLGRLAKRKKSS